MSDIQRRLDGLEGDWKKLRLKWNSSGDQWDDPVRDRFELEFWEEIERVVSRLVHEMQSLSNVIEEAHRRVP